MSMIEIFTYNILSQPLAEQMLNEVKNEEKVYDKTYMAEEIRWHNISTIIQNKIDTSIDTYLIFCLQEVCEEWIPKFAQLFNSNEYLYINVQHGRVFNGNMGVLIAYSNTILIIKSEFYTVGRHIFVTDDNSKLAASKTNTAILILFETPHINFGVVTYHMPLEPSTPHISMSHAKVLIKKIGRFMENNIWFYAGDFNILPDTRTYSFLSTNNNCIWATIKKYPITNYSYIRNFEFNGCLDYIFYSKSLNIKLIDVTYDIIDSIIPDNKQPSDHIPISAKFMLN